MSKLVKPSALLYAGYCSILMMETARLSETPVKEHHFTIRRIPCTVTAEIPSNLARCVYSAVCTNVFSTMSIVQSALMLFPGLPVLMAAAVLLVLASCPGSISADDTGTNFFLKASKSVPRIGRRSEYDIYLKTPKNVPRIGRRREMSPLVSIKSVAYRWRQQQWGYLVLGGWC